MPDGDVSIGVTSCCKDKNHGADSMHSWGLIQHCSATIWYMFHAAYAPLEMTAFSGHTFPLSCSELAVHVICCKVDFQLSAIEVKLIQISYGALCCLSVKIL